MFTISKSFSFSASHQLSRLPSTHKCSRLHGHNYKVELVLQASELNEYGFVVDYGDLKPFKDYIDAHFDHSHLNDFFGASPTAEVIAHCLFIVAYGMWEKKVKSVRVFETDNTWAEYSE